jgi:hypothetical protein
VKGEADVLGMHATHRVNKREWDSNHLSEETEGRVVASHLEITMHVKLAIPHVPMMSEMLYILLQFTKIVNTKIEREREREEVKRTNRGENALNIMMCCIPHE